MTPADLRSRRLALRLSQDELARAVPCHVNSLNRWEAGEYQPSPLSLDAWQRALATFEITLLYDLLARYPWAAGAAWARKDAA
jgi:transcriptional regulator with XRE-family HTH domain